MISALFDTVNSQGFLNGLPGNIGDPGSQSHDGLTIGIRFGGTNEPLDGDIGAVIMLDALADTIFRARIERCLMQRYGITPNTGACQ